MALAGVAAASDVFNGLTFSNTGTGTGTSSMLGFAFTLKSTSTDYTVTNTLGTKFPDVLTLTEVSFDKVFVYNKSNQYGLNITSKDVYLYITDTTGTILGISEAAAVSASTAANNTGGSVTFTLDCDGIKKDTTYRAWFMGTDTGYTTSDSGIQTITLTDNTVELRSSGALVSTTGDLKLLTSTSPNTSNHTFAGMSMKAIPEPTTATLSLLALMGLAARRRRKLA